MRQLLIAAALLLALGCERPNPFFSERNLGAGGILLSAPPFSGGTLSAPLVLDATNTLCSEALALSFSGDADLGVQRSAANILLLCASGGITLNGGITFSGVATDITAVAGETIAIVTTTTGDIDLTAGDDVNLIAAGEIALRPNSDATGLLLREPGTSRFELGQGESAGGPMLMLRANGEGASIGERGDRSATEVVAYLADGMGGGVTGTHLLDAYGEKTMAFVPGDALVLTDVTDTASTPLGASTTGAGTACRISVAIATAWTPSETGAVDGMFWCCTNTAAAVITMTESAGVYEGTCILGQYDAVCFEYVTAQFIQRSCMDN